MKTEIRYICEICQRWYSDKESALECEARGVPSPNIPVGLLKMGEPGDFYDHRLAFALASADIKNHTMEASWWACRGQGYNGDSLGEETCGMPGRGIEYVEFNSEWLNRPEMQRLIAWLEKNKIKPLVFVNGEVIPLSKAIK